MCVYLNTNTHIYICLYVDIDIMIFMVMYNTYKKLNSDKNNNYKDNVEIVVFNV